MATREIYLGISHHDWLYVAAAVALAVLAYGIVRRWRLIAAGEGSLGVELWPALRTLARDGLGGAPLWRRPARGLAHIFILWGMLALAVGTLTVFLKADFGLPVYQGGWYLSITLAMDLLGLLAIAGVLYFLLRRLFVTSLRARSSPEDYAVLGVLILVLAGGFVLEGLRLAAMEDAWSGWSPVGALIAVPFDGADGQALTRAYEVLWWVHLLGALALIAWLPFSKLAHVVLAPAQQALRDPDAATPRPIDFEDETLEAYGLADATGLVRGQRLAIEACTDCGRCEDVCPAVATGKSLSPRRAVLGLRAALERGEQTGPPGEAVGTEAVWQCLNCMACSRECPVFIEQPALLLEVRRGLTMNEGDCPREAELALRNLEANFNPWGFGWAERAAWCRPLDEEDERLPVGVPVEGGWLLWVGCAGSFDDRARRVALATARLLRAAHVPFTILGTEEHCCGDPARRMGNEYLFQLLAEHNITAFRNAEVKRIVTFCPHCYSVIAREYPTLGGEFEVMHHSELLARLLREGRLVAGARAYDPGGEGSWPPASGTADTHRGVVYHDSCILARQMGVMMEPRQILNELPTVRRTEPPHPGVSTSCCGGGGGHVFMEETAGGRVSHVRLRELLSPDPQAVATACPFCLTMLEDAAKALDADIKVADIAELLAASLDERHAMPAAMPPAN